MELVGAATGSGLSLVQEARARLRSHLLPRRWLELVGSEQRTIPPVYCGLGDVGICRIRGRRLEAGRPIDPGAGVQTGYDGVGVMTVT